MLSLAALLTTLSACGSAQSPLEISPSSPDVIPGGNVQFTTNTPTAGEPIAWAILEPGGGTINPAGFYTAPGSEGTYTVTASLNSLSTTTQVRVKRNIRVDVNPSSATLAAGASLTFTANVTGADKTVTWSVAEGATAGTITAAGVYTAPQTTGTYHVIATSNADPTKSGSATITVTPPPPVTSSSVSIAVSPQTASIVAGSTLQFTATVTGSTNVGVTWSVAESGGGTVNSTGLYTAPLTVGTYHVVANSVADATKSATATVTVTAPSVSVSVSPTTASVTTGATQSFTATVTGTTNTAVTWSVQEGAAGGTVSSTGLYLAPSTAGTYHVIATSQADGTSSATATVTITAGGTTQPAYYASPSGSGTSCTLASPCSLTTGLQKLTAGYTLFLRAGTYNQTVTVSASGTASSRITIAGYPGETAIIDGADTLPSVSWGVLVNLTGSYVTLRDLEVRSSLWMGLKLSGTYDEAINVYSHDNWENGILVSGNYGLVEGCRVYNNAKSNVNCSRTRSYWASGLSAARVPTGAILRKNTVWNNWGEGISAYEAYNTTIEDNVSHDNYSINLYISDAVGTLAQRNLVYVSGTMTCGGAQVGIAISSEGQTPNNSDTTLINNMVGNANINFYFYSADTDGMTNTLIANNTFVNSRSGTNFEIGDSRVHVNTAIRNNLILQEDSLPIAVVTGSGLTFTNNLWSKTPPSSAASSTDVVANPQLAKMGSAAQPDYYKLTSTSPAIHKAVALTQVPDDFFGNARSASPDIGADEL